MSRCIRGQVQLAEATSATWLQPAAPPCAGIVPSNQPPPLLVLLRRVCVLCPPVGALMITVLPSVSG